MIGSDFLLIVFIYCVINKKKTNRVGSYIDYPDAIKNKKTTINPINKKDNKCFQCAATVALNHEEIGKHSKRIKKIQTLTNKNKETFLKNNKNQKFYK